MELFGAAGALGHDDAQPGLAPGRRAGAGLHGVDHLPHRVPATFDMEVASSKYLYGLPDGEVPLAFNFNGTVHYRGDDGRLQMSLVPWSCSAEFRMPVATWRDLIEHYYPSTGWIALREETLLALQREKARARRCRRSTRAWRSCLRLSVDRTRRFAALRGLRALPVHAGRDQERHARRRSGSSTRPRTPRTLDIDPRPPRAPVHGRGRRRDRRPRCASCCRAASATGRAAAHRGRRRVRARRAVSPHRAHASTPAGRRPPAGVLPGREPHARCPAGLERGRGARATR